MFFLKCMKLGGQDQCQLTTLLLSLILVPGTPEKRELSPSPGLSPLMYPTRQGQGRVHAAP